MPKILDTVPQVFADVNAHLALFRPTTVALASAGIVLAAYTVADFFAWTRFAYNIPHNPLYYAFVRVAKIVGHDTTTHAARLRKSQDTRRFLADLPERRGPVPQLPAWPFPHRHIPQLTTPSFLARLEAHLVSASSKHNLLLAPSIREGGHATSLYSQPNLPNGPNKGLFENDRMHVHRDDASVHVSLTPRDAAEVMQKGWATVFPLAGFTKTLDEGHVLLFAPRDEEELGRVLEIMDAGIQFSLTKL
ncbi:hypothetical protein EXIGLDRAFT_830299 [Exidia glandulosa HHB12029]|uniref:Luciferase domain-containing protein n=1 Tax=Exidia glandulosa HHB12029 TaxID=1314781 RepID=A0A165NRP2_EXIGL|nr:hypothetical protein EXIGLDRAFT_830299 [Exidia glandulosa HHB12029]